MMMRMSKFAMVAAACLTLTACGEDWVPQLTTEYVPYGEERTAGSGIVYVRKSMLPPKTEIKAAVEPPKAEIKAPEPKIQEAVKVEPPPIMMPKDPEPAAPVLKADEMFDGGVK